MKNRYLLTALNVFLALISCTMLFTACENEDLNTNQMGSSEVTLKAFGPSPIARGAELRIIGTNLDKVESVTIPGAPAITNIKHVSATEIRATVPQTAEVGFITLKAGDKIIKSVTELTYSEPISIDKITPAEAKPGATIKIEGEYLNLIKEVIFADTDTETNHVLQANFVSQDRKAIELKVPLTAQTGKVIVSDGADLVPEDEEPGIPIWVYSEEELTVTLPAITKLAPQPVKPGSELTITGTNLDLVELLRFGASDIEVSEFTINSAKTEIKVTVPEETQFDEATKKGDVRLIALSGLEVAANLQLAAPAITSISPSPAKNGEALIIKGTNLDLATSVSFAGDVDGEISSQTATEIEVIVPATATEGDVVLNTYSGQTAAKAYTLVKPTISSIAPLSLTAGDNLTINGSNLDVVNEVIFKSGTGTVSVNLTEAPNSTSFSIRTPFTATDGTISLKTVNGTTVNSTQSLTIAAASLPIVTGDVPKLMKPKGLITLTGVNLNVVTKIEFQYTGSTVEQVNFLPSADGTSLQFFAPEKKGEANVVLYKEVETVEIGIVIVGTYDEVVDPNLIMFDFDTHKWQWSNYADFTKVIEDADDAISGNYCRITGISSEWVQYFAANNGDYQYNLTGVTVADYAWRMDVKIASASSGLQFKIRLGNYWYIWNISEDALIGEDWHTVTFPLNEFRDNDGNGDLLTDISKITGASTERGLCTQSSTGTVDVKIDNVRFELNP